MENKSKVYVVLCTYWSSISGDSVKIRVFTSKDKAREAITKEFKQYKRECIEEGFDKEYFVETNRVDYKSFSPDDWEKYGVTLEIREGIME